MSVLIDLKDLCQRLADRSPSRTEANVQSELHALLLVAPFQLEEGQLNDIVLEQPTGHRRRIDVEAGLCVFEVKRDLRAGRVREEAEVQLADYVASRSKEMGQRYVGVLTDGCEWHLYRLQGDLLTLVSSIQLDAKQPDTEALVVWLEGVLATGEQLLPTPPEIKRLLGTGTPGFLLDLAELTELFFAGKSRPSVQLKRRLWAKLLTTALGTAFRDDDQLFILHTFLVITAEVIAHAVLDIDPKSVPPQSLVSGQQFRAAKVLGVVESDFFDWVVEVPGGDVFVRGLARRLSRFTWANVEHDVLKILYESVISPEQRKQLGEYYTPDWLAERIVEEVVQSPRTMRVLDPACGSGTFVFYAVRRYLEAAVAAGKSNSEALAGLCANVMGMDLHPVAVTLARVTYLLGIGTQRLKEPRGPISIPIFLGDSLQWGQEETLQTHNALVIPVEDSPQLFPSELRFPDSLVSDAGRFDGLVAELADYARERKPASPVPTLSQVFRRFAVPPEDQPVVTETFRLMCNLHDQGRDHIWGYYVRNLARPRWLARKDNKVDVLVGNPPWLSYRFMTTAMQKEFQRLSKERGLWAGATSATHVDLSALFVVRCIERYLGKSGAFGFVMPLAVLSRQQFVGFRKASWSRVQGFPVCVEFEKPWDLHDVKPTFFEVPCSVVLGGRAEKPQPMPTDVESWSGRLPKDTTTWAVARDFITVQKRVIKSATTDNPASIFAARFSQGASFAPRMLCFVEVQPCGPLGTVAGEVSVKSRRTVSEKKPWIDLPAIEGNVESCFVMPVHLGETVLPYRPLEPLRAIIPWDGKRLLHGGDERLAAYPGLHSWWTKVEECWTQHRSSDRLSMLGQIDFRKKLSTQFLPTGHCADHRIVYSKSGMYLAAARIDDSLAVIDTKLYWAACSSDDEAAYLCAILNSDAVTLAVRGFQARGEHNPRDFDKYVWQLPIPAFDPNEQNHRLLAQAGREAEAFVAKLDLPKTRFEKQRRFIREQLAATDIGKKIELTVKTLLSGGKR